MCRVGLFAMLLGSLNGHAQPLAREPIEKAYRMMYRAAALKYRYGLFAHRASNFKAYDPNGRLVTPETEAAFLDELIVKAITIRETGQIVSFSQPTPDTVECEVTDLLEVVVVTELTRRNRSKMEIRSRSRDRWKREGDHWVQESSYLLEQAKRETPMNR